MQLTEVELNSITAKFEKSQNDLVVQSADFSLQGLKEMVDTQIIDLDPKYQRRERWDAGRQSLLIESFLLNVPVPSIYLAEEEYGIYSIIDGKQRVTAIADFLSNSFKLRGLSELPQINGRRFRELPKALQNALRVRPYLRVITLLKQSNPELKYEVFIRLNRGGVQLNNQEIRNVAFKGPLNDAIYDASEAPFLRKALRIDSKKSAAYQQMIDAEYVLRFLTLEAAWEDFTGSLVKSMDHFMLENQHADTGSAQRQVAPFHIALERCEKIWGEHAFQRWDHGEWRNQALAGMYDAEMLAVIIFDDAEYLKLVEKRTDVLDQTKQLFADPDFEEAVRLGTNTPARLKERVNRVISMLASIAHS